MPGQIINKYGQLFVEYVHNGKRSSYPVPSYEVGQEVIQQIDIELQDKIPELKFEIFAEKYFKTIKTSCKESTYNDYKTIYKYHIAPFFNGKQIDSIQKSDIRDLLHLKLKNRAVSTVKHIKSVISGIFWIAVEDGIIKTNPALNIRKIFPRKSRSLKIFLTKKQVDLLLKTTQNHNLKYYPLILVLARTGMRLGEARALKWTDIDFDNRTIYVNRSIVRGIIGKPKNHEIRLVDMSQHLADTLKNMNRKSEWLFPGRNKSKPLDGDSFRKKIFKPLLKLAKLPQTTRIHDLRHSYASTMIQNGINIKYISDQLGHHSISITADIYGHLEPNTNKQAVDDLDRQTSC